jgi:hypothetical protein
MDEEDVIKQNPQATMQTMKEPMIEPPKKKKKVRKNDTHYHGAEPCHNCDFSQHFHFEPTTQI